MLGRSHPYAQVSADTYRWGLRYAKNTGALIAYTNLKRPQLGVSLSRALHCAVSDCQDVIDVELALVDQTIIAAVNAVSAACSRIRLTIPLGNRRRFSLERPTTSRFAYFDRPETNRLLPRTIAYKPLAAPLTSLVNTALVTDTAVRATRP